MPENINPPIGSRSTCRVCGEEVIYVWNLNCNAWEHWIVKRDRFHPPVPIDHAEPVKCPICNGVHSEYCSACRPADARTVEELVRTAQRGLVKFADHGDHYERVDKAWDAVLELARRLGVNNG